MLTLVQNGKKLDPGGHLGVFGCEAKLHEPLIPYVVIFVWLF